MKQFSHEPYMKDTLSVFIQVPTAEIGYVNSLVESYEGLALVRTIDEDAGFLEIYVIQEFKSCFDQFLSALESEIPLRRTNPHNVMAK